MAPEEPDSIRPLLDVAAERGVISGAQRDALIALHAEGLTSTSFSADAAVSAQPAERRAAGAITQLDAPRTSLPRRTSSWGVELPSGLNSVTVAYTIGAMLVVFAAAWFLADRWKSLGPWGVLLVVLLYAGVLVGSSVWLERRDYRQASAALRTLAVALTPVAVWSLEVITGFWPVGARSSWMDDSNQWMAVCWIVVDLTTLLAALLALRWRPSVSLTIPVTVMMWGLWLHLSRAVVGEQLVGALDRWLFLVNGLLLCAVAGEADRWQIRVRLSGQRTEGDFAFFLWLGGLIAFALGYLIVWANAGPWRHLMLVVALILVTLSLYLRRRTHLVFGLLALFGYLAFLALDVFREYLSLPAILGTLGIVLILATVWVQRRFPRLVNRVNADRDFSAPPPMVTRGPFLLAVGMALLSIIDLPEEVAQKTFSQRWHILAQHSGSARARGVRSRPREGTPGQDSSSTQSRR